MLKKIVVSQLLCDHEPTDLRFLAARSRVRMGVRRGMGVGVFGDDLGAYQGLDAASCEEIQCYLGMLNVRSMSVLF